LQYRRLKTLLARLEKLSQIILRYQATLAQSQKGDLTAKTGVILYIPALSGCRQAHKLGKWLILRKLAVVLK